MFASGGSGLFRNVVNTNFSIASCVCFTLSLIVNCLEVIYRLLDVWVLQDENRIIWGLEIALTFLTE